MIEDLRTVLELVAGDPRVTIAGLLERLPAETRGAATSTSAHVRAVAQQPYSAPAGATEEKVAAIWAELFGVDRVGADDNFFDLGGQSVLLVRAHERLRQEVRPDIPITALFAHPTVRSLARHLARGDGHTAVAAGATRDRARRQQQAAARIKAARGKR